MAIGNLHRMTPEERAKALGKEEGDLEIVEHDEKVSGEDFSKTKNNIKKNIKELKK